MRILSIETSCDETALSIIEVHGKSKPRFTVLANLVASQAKLHAEFGGVFPMMAKREHSKALIPLLKQALKRSHLLVKKPKKKIETATVDTSLESLLSREPELLAQFQSFIPSIEKPNIDLIAVTVGPGLEPALWVGIKCAEALSRAWDIPVIPVNHMEGHVVSIFPKKNEKAFSIPDFKFPLLSLLVSGGHTELVLIKKWGAYKIIGATRDDACGEAFDKVARMLELPYPGGPEISKLAAVARQDTTPRQSRLTLPRPMIHSADYDFSFSGLKTAVLYLLRDLQKDNPKILQKKNIKNEIAREFEDAVVDVLATKTLRALKEYKIKTLIIGGGVAANRALRTKLTATTKAFGVDCYFPRSDMTGDNSLMIAIAGYMNSQNKKRFPRKLIARGNLGF